MESVYDEIRLKIHEMAFDQIADTLMYKDLWVNTLGKFFEISDLRPGYFIINIMKVRIEDEISKHDNLS